MFPTRRDRSPDWPEEAALEFGLDTPECVTYSFLQAISFLQVYASWGVLSMRTRLFALIEPLILAPPQFAQAVGATLAVIIWESYYFDRHQHATNAVRFEGRVLKKGEPL
jgi:hypothetical protein